LAAVRASFVAAADEDEALLGGRAELGADASGDGTCGAWFEGLAGGGFAILALLTDVVTGRVAEACGETRGGADWMLAD